MIYAAVALARVVSRFLGVGRALLGPTVYDRILAANMFGTKTVLLIAVAGFIAGRPEFLDLAVVYVLVNYVGVLAILRFSKYGNLADDDQARP